MRSSTSTSTTVAASRLMAVRKWRAVLSVNCGSSINKTDLLTTTSDPVVLLSGGASSLASPAVGRHVR